MKKILFLCEANIGRSQMAEGYFNHFIGEQVAISAAVKDYCEKYHFRPTKEMIDAMKEDGIDISNHRIKLVTSEMLREVQKIIVLCDKTLCPEFVLNDRRTVFYQIEDPFGKETDRIRMIRDQIKGIVLEVIKNIDIR